MNKDLYDEVISGLSVDFDDIWEIKLNSVPSSVFEILPQVGVLL